MAKQDDIIVSDAILGGISDSIYLGSKNSLASIVGFDLHSIPGIMLVNQKMTAEGGGAPTDDYYKIVPCSDGHVYYFGKTNGKVYKNANGSGTYTLLGTVSPAAGSAGILDAVEFNGNIYYAMQNRLGQWTFSGAFSGRNDNYGTFTNGNATYHPIIFVPNQNSIYIGDSNILAQVQFTAPSTTTFTASGLTLTSNLTITSVGRQGSDILMGTSITNNVGYAYVVRWNGWSQFVEVPYPINEAGINAFFPSEDEVIINAGISGNMYHLTQGGSVFEIVKQIPPIFPNTYSPTLNGIVNYPAVANKQGIPLFGFSTKTGDPALEGIYSWGHRNQSYPKILNLEFPVSTGNLSGITIWSIATRGNDVYVSSYDSGTNTYQIDKLDWSNKFNGAYFETKVITISRVWLDDFNRFMVNTAQTLPASTHIDLYYKINGGSYVLWNYGTESISDSIHNSTIVDKLIQARTLQIKVQVTTNGNNAPIIEDLIIYPEQRNNG